AQQVRIILKSHRRLVQTALLFHVDLVGAVDQDIAHVRVAQKDLEWTETENLIQQVVDKGIALHQRQRHRLQRKHGTDERDDLLARRLARQAVQLLQVESL